MKLFATQKYTTPGVIHSAIICDARVMSGVLGMSGGALELAVLGLVWDARPAVPDGWARWGWRARAARAVRVGRLAQGGGRGGGRNGWSGAGGKAIELDQVGGGAWWSDRVGRSDKAARGERVKRAWGTCWVRMEGGAGRWG